MPWKEVDPMEQRIQFVMSVKEGSLPFSQVCYLYGISRKTGYKWWNRYQAEGLPGLGGRSSRPWTSPNQTSELWRERIIELKLKHRFRGPRKLHAMLQKRFEDVPAASTMGNILGQEGLTKPKRRRRSSSKVTRKSLTQPVYPNDVWSADFKGWFRTLDGNRCDPLTISDLATRYLLCCKVCLNQKELTAKAVFIEVFREYGLPQVIRVDNGAPFGSRGPSGLSSLSVWWMRLGIKVEFIEPGNPQQNGSHERMHKTLKAETTKPPSCNRNAQQRRFNKWRKEFNWERPHEALGQIPPASRYEKSARAYLPVAGDVQYEPTWEVRRVRSTGEIKWKSRLRFIGRPFRGQRVGLLLIKPGIYQVYFAERLLGEIHDSDPKGIRPVTLITKKRAKSARYSNNKTAKKGK
ncbi:MAG: IS481 family transposase [Verrucomicrobiota bacterium]